MSGMRAFDSSTTLTVSEGYDLTNQQHYSKRRCRCSCDFLNKKCSFRVWHILLFLLIIALVIALMALLVAMYGPGTTDLKYSKRRGADSPGVVGGGQNTEKPIGEATTTTESTEGTTAPGKETTSAKPTERKTTVGTAKHTTLVTTSVSTATQRPATNARATPTLTKTKQPSTTAERTTPVTIQKTTGQTTAASTTKPPTTTAPDTTALPTTQAPTTIIPEDKTSLECGVAIVGGGTGGLLMAHALLDNGNETNVCIFEREDRLGGKIFDFNFTQAPDVAVGLGVWNIYGHNEDELNLASHLDIDYDLWVRETHRVEARGVFADSFDSLKSKAFPTLRNRVPMNNKTLEKTAKFIFDPARNYTQFSTAETFLSYELSPEGAKLMADTYGFMGDYLQTINPLSYRTYLENKTNVGLKREEDVRPKLGMSEFITKLAEKVRSNSRQIIYRQETVTSVGKIDGKFVLETTNYKVKANKTVLTAAPMALKKITGDVMQGITGHDIFNSIVSVPAFHGAAVYETAWWNDSIAAQKNNSLQPLEMFISSSNCLGISMPYNGVAPNGRAVLHTIANNGGCSDKWGEMLKISAKEVDKELKRALKYKFQREDVPDPLETKYKYWDEGFWFLQKPGANFNLSDVQEWAKRPLTGQDVFLVDRAFYSFGGWLEDTIKSSLAALKEGWNLDFSLE